MTSIDGSTGWRSLKQKLSFKGLGCCGALWSPTRAPITILDHSQQHHHQEEQEQEHQPMMLMMMMMQETHQEPLPTSLACDNFTGGEEENALVVRSNNGGGNLVGPTSSGMNLAMALAAERNLRLGPNKDSAGPQNCKTLMRLIEETDGVDLRMSKRMNGDDADKDGTDWLCCVCMERSKGAAFIPCGHTYCRVCARDLWINRGCCPMCNRSILEILDIF